MSKAKIKYVCNNCGYESPTWLGKCPSCGEWNTFTEEKVVKRTARRSADYASEPVKLNGEVSSESERVLTGIAEFDRTLGGGFMPGSLVLIGGDPGIGKSTLVMQAAAKSNIQTLYVTGEESVNQINLRAKRLKIKAENISLLAETNYEEIENAALKLKPDLLIIDSIQTVYDPRIENAPGTVTQLREVTANLMRLSKTKNITTLIIGHVTKDGFIAGPKILEHIVDTVLQFEGEKNHAFRILRALKNRFGNTNEIGVFEMTESGLRQVENPSEIFLSQKEKELPGSVITASLEGSRAVLIEVQALTTRTNYGNPQRVATGFDYKRLAILLAVLDKRAELRTGYYNVFVNIAGGLKIFEPAIDLAVCVAIASSMNDKVISSDTLFIGEVGLGGEIRIVSNAEKRIAEAEKLGLKKIFLPKGNLKNIKTNKAELIPVNDISDVFYKLGIK
jgi:DNA repair protein RadA/Sms